MWFQQTVVTTCDIHSLKIVMNIIIIVNNINFNENKHKEKQQQQALPLPSSSSTSHTASPSYSPVSPLSILISRVFPPFPFSFPFSSSSALPTTLFHSHSCFLNICHHLLLHFHAFLFWLPHIKRRVKFQSVAET